MANVIAKQRGYFGSMIREAGEVFHWPDDMDLASWVKLHSSAEPVDVPEPAKADGKAKATKGKAKVEPVDVPEPAPFSDAPAPQTVLQGNGVSDALGGVAPDWMAPGAPTPVTD